jgi:AraC-like DNA-binding protein
LFQNINKLTGIEKVNQLYLILETLGKSRFFTLIAEQAFNAENNNLPYNESIDQAYNFLYAHFKEHIQLSQVAEQVHLNPSALSRAFKRETGMNIFQIINKLRIENACKMLSSTNWGIAQIAYCSGFSNLSHFNRQFQKIIHVSPKGYRTQISE